MLDYVVFFFIRVNQKKICQIVMLKIHVNHIQYNFVHRSFLPNRCSAQKPTLMKSSLHRRVCIMALLCCADDGSSTNLSLSHVQISYKHRETNEQRLIVFIYLLFQSWAWIKPVQYTHSTASKHPLAAWTVFQCSD